MQSFELIPISNLRQHVFCPRIPWFKMVLNFEPPEQTWMKQGSKWHTEQENKQSRRKLKNVSEPFEKKTNVYVRSQTLGIHGYVDELTITEDEVIVVEYKSDRQKPMQSQIMQLCAYAYAASEQFDLPAKRGVLLKGTVYKQFWIEFTPELKLKMLSVLTEMQKNIQTHRIPFSSADGAKCSQCEYLRYCNDR